MKLLRPPFGNGTGDKVSLLLQGVLDEAKLVATLLGYSCYPPAVPKVVSCLRASGRYDCELQSCWFRSQFRRLTEDLMDAGVGLVVRDVTAMDPKRFSWQ